MTVNIDKVRNKFEDLARENQPDGLSRGRHPVHGTYLHSGLEKRWKGFLSAAHEFDNEIQAYREELERLIDKVPTPYARDRIRQLLERY